MFYVTYMLSELRRRKGRTFLTALGLAVGVGLVVTVNALSTGLDRAQAAVLEPLTGVGTDLSVNRPIDVSSEGSGAGPLGLSEKERRQLEEENGDARIGLRNLGEPGERFSRDDFVATSQLSFPAGEVDEVRRLDGVSAAAGGLTLNAVHIEGVVPELSDEPQTEFAPPPTSQGQQGPENLDFNSLAVSGVDQRQKALGAITAGQISSGRYFSASDTSREAILNVSYARRQGISAGETIRLGGKKFEVVGLAETPLGGQAADVYIKLGQLQEMSDREGRVNTIYVRATSSDEVATVAGAVKNTLEGASVTTAQELADRVSGSLVDAKNLAGKIGTALALVGLPGPQAQPADHDGPGALAEGLGDVLRELPPAVDAEEAGLPVGPLVALADAGGDGQAEGGHGGAVGGEAELGVVGEVADQGNERVRHCCPLLGALGAGAGPTTCGRAAGPRAVTAGW